MQDATAPGAPYAPNVRLYTLLALLAGLCIGIGAVFLLEYLDNTTKVDTPFNELIGAPLMTTIPIVPSMEKLPHQLFILDQPMSPEAESVRLLRANVEFAIAHTDAKTLAITSAGPGEGKSTVVANLAVAMAQAGFSVVVIDADMRRPAQQEAFNLSNERGLSTLLARSDVDWNAVARTNADLKLRVITSGPIPPNPGDLLKSPRFNDLLETLSKEVDMVIIDTPPALAVSDALVVADVAKDVLLVSRANETRVDKLQAAVAALPESARVIGVALNHQKRGKAESYYYYYSSNDSSGGDSPSSPEWLGPQTWPKGSASSSREALARRNSGCRNERSRFVASKCERNRYTGRFALKECRPTRVGCDVRSGPSSNSSTMAISRCAVSAALSRVPLIEIAPIIARLMMRNESSGRSRAATVLSSSESAPKPRLSETTSHPSSASKVSAATIPARIGLCPTGQLLLTGSTRRLGPIDSERTRSCRGKAWIVPCLSITA